jgi:hypothetical protein
MRLKKFLDNNKLSISDAFRELDKWNKGYLSIYDLEDLLSE